MKPLRFTSLILMAMAVRSTMAADLPGLDATYLFDTIKAGQTPVVEQTDPTINFSFATGQGPQAGYLSAYYSVIWTGSVKAPVDGLYTFYVTADDCARLWVGENWLVSRLAYSGGAATTVSGTIMLKAGVQTPLFMRMWQFGGPSQAKLEWSGPGLARQVVPSTVLSTGGWTRIDAPQASYESPVSALIHYRPAVIPTITVSPSTALASPLMEVGQETHLAEIKLIQGQAVTVSVSAEDQAASKGIRWQPLDFKATLPAQVNIRVGSKILVAVRTGGKPYLTLGYDRTPTSVTPVGGFYQIPLTTAGSYVIDDNLGGKTVTVNAISIPFDPAAAGGTVLVPANYQTVATTPNIVPSSVASLIKVNTFNHILYTGSDFNTTTNKLVAGTMIFSVDGQTGYNYVRIGDTGSILSLIPIKGYNVGNGPAVIDTTNPDGSKSGLSYIEVYPFFRNIRFTMTMRAHTATFLNGSKSFTVATDGTPTSLGEQGFRELTMPNGTKRGVIQVRVNFPPNESKWCFTSESQQLTP